MMGPASSTIVWTGLGGDEAVSAIFASCFSSCRHKEKCRNWWLFVEGYYASRGCGKGNFSRTWSVRAYHHILSSILESLGHAPRHPTLERVSTTSKTYTPEFWELNLRSRKSRVCKCSLILVRDFRGRLYDRSSSRVKSSFWQRHGNISSVARYTSAIFRIIRLLTI